jgi:hypothetical protein
MSPIEVGLTDLVLSTQIAHANGRILHSLKSFGRATSVE